MDPMVIGLLAMRNPLYRLSRERCGIHSVGVGEDAGVGIDFGFQAQEGGDEWSGEGNVLAFKYRVHDAQLGRCLSIDPLTPEYSWNSPCAFSENRVIDGIELEGLERTSCPKFLPVPKLLIHKCISKAYVYQNRFLVRRVVLSFPDRRPRGPQSFDISLRNFPSLRIDGVIINYENRANPDNIAISLVQGAGSNSPADQNLGSTGGPVSGNGEFTVGGGQISDAPTSDGGHDHLRLTIAAAPSGETYSRTLIYGDEDLVAKEEKVRILGLFNIRTRVIYYSRDRSRNMIGDTKDRRSVFERKDSLLKGSPYRWKHVNRRRFDNR